MAGYLGTKAVLLSTTAADVIGNAEIGGSLTVGGTVTADGLTVDGNAFVKSGNTLTLNRADNAIGGAMSYVAGTGFIFNDANGDGTSFNVGATNRMRIDSSGNVGIGLTPSFPLHVSGSAAVTGSVYVGSTFSAATPDYSFLADSGLGMFRLPNVLGFSVAGTERMRIDASGNLLVGTTSANTTTGLSLSPAGGINYIVAGSTGYASGFYTSGSVSNNAGSIFLSGSSTSYNTSSDYRLKTDAQPMTGASARVQALKPVNFEWIASGTRVDGFLAHEAQEVVPEAVTGTKDAMRDEEYEVTPAVYEDVVIPAVLDEEGNELEAERTEQRLVTEAVMGTRSVPDYQGIDQSKLVPLLTAALQEALTKIDDMETRLAALEGK